LSWLTSARNRLTASYVAVMFLAMAAFGAVAVIVIDRDLHASLDARLRTTAEAALNFVDVKPSINIDERDREQLLALPGSQIDLAVLSDTSGIVLSTMAAPSADLVGYARRSVGYATLQRAGVSVRALVLPVTSEGKRVGAVIAWAPASWIEDTDRHVAIAFAVAALVLALVASITGSAVARRALEDAFARQRRFTTDASHELRAPLSVIRAEADLALRQPRDTLSYQRALETIAAETDRMEKLVSTLLVAARTHDAHGDRAIIDLSALARRVCDRLRPAAHVKHVVVTTDGRDCSALGDADAIERAVTAVLHNAIKHTPSRGTIRVSLARRLGNCELCVHDSGPGFSTQALAHGLEWFWREEHDRSGEATGLGLAIANSIVRASSGHITLANGPDGGGEVTIVLPAR